MSHPLIVLGSRSPRRRELLSLLVPNERILIQPPADPEEPGFEGLHHDVAITNQLRRIARLKNEIVRREARYPSESLVLTADTVIVAGTPDHYEVLGQPPSRPDWRDTVRHWFREFYFGRTHRAMTAVELSWPDGRRVERLVETTVTMRGPDESLLEWYLATGEPIGKAGGYALQGAGSVFITRVDGSLSNVVGLPLEVVRDMLASV